MNLPARSEIVPEPYGVALIVGCWNYPVQVRKPCPNASKSVVQVTIEQGDNIFPSPCALSFSTACRGVLMELVASRFCSSSRTSPSTPVH